MVNIDMNAKHKYIPLILQNIKEIQPFSLIRNSAKLNNKVEETSTIILVIPFSPHGNVHLFV